MRAFTLPLIALAMGVALMATTAEQAPGQEKKEKEFPPLPKGNPEFTEKVTVKRWNPDKKLFNATTEGVNAFRWSAKSGNWFTLKTEDIGGTKIYPGSEVKDEDGNTYEVLDNPVSADKKVRVKKKP